MHPSSTKLVGPSYFTSQAPVTASQPLLHLQDITSVLQAYKNANQLSIVAEGHLPFITDSLSLFLYKDDHKRYLISVFDSPDNILPIHPTLKITQGKNVQRIETIEEMRSIDLLQFNGEARIYAATPKNGNTLWLFQVRKAAPFHITNPYQEQHLYHIFPMNLCWYIDI